MWWVGKKIMYTFMVYNYSSIAYENNLLNNFKYKYNYVNIIYYYKGLTAVTYKKCISCVYWQKPKFRYLLMWEVRHFPIKKNIIVHDV